MCRLILIICSRDELKHFGTDSVYTCGLIGSRDFSIDFSSSDLMSGSLKCIFSGFFELMNSFNTSAL